ncbi:Sulfite exporter TauE/SafE [Listeria grayi]|uniref:Probable membrane transporter protein n=1 Tax=Listeria grayi FSL F6-1183 TaxID=1265827 RepID=A0A829R9Q8_LISGR|nr:sulfite exporter TauE/SafE family protein [Listeria grayi]EUJ30474.1 permease [Listeria grayi FSL F6-1183]MBC1921603.1 sulfite exporter TauE/SafE family protein [Listeria grayi]VEI31386.1 Sulfite exporter TauE/SafE [Listeria grayi]
MLIIITMVILGLLLGFVGAGGAGVTLAILVSFFNIPIHVAIGTSLLGLISTALFGSISHTREKNIDFKIGSFLGLSGGIGALIASFCVKYIPESNLSLLTSIALISSSIILWIRISIMTNGKEKNLRLKSIILRALFFGIILGSISGLFGIASSAFIQITLLLVFGLDLRKSAGTTMLVILPISLIGGIGYIANGYIDVLLLIKVILGTSIGTYIGAKFTNRLSPLILKIAMISVPLIGAIILISTHN